MNKNFNIHIIWIDYSDTQVRGHKPKVITSTTVKAENMSDLIISQYNRQSEAMFSNIDWNKL